MMVFLLLLLFFIICVCIVSVLLYYSVRVCVCSLYPGRTDATQVFGPLRISATGIGYGAPGVCEASDYCQRVMHEKTWKAVVLVY